MIEEHQDILLILLGQIIMSLIVQKFHLLIRIHFTLYIYQNIMFHMCTSKWSQIKNIEIYKTESKFLFVLRKFKSYNFQAAL